jgi:hypothetical protein
MNILTINELAEIRRKADAYSILKAENERLRAALNWYASPKTWNQWCPESFADRARTVLAQRSEAESQ